MEKKIDIRSLTISYKSRIALSGVTLSVFTHEILAVIGPANSGKSSFIRSINRMIDLNPHARVTGEIRFDGKNIYNASFDVNALRTRIGMIFPIPMPLPMSVFENLAYGPRLHGLVSEEKLYAKAEQCLKASSLWDEVKQRLDMPALRLSGGQQQRLCLARALMVEPEVLLFDEPCSGLDPISTAKVEATMKMLAKKYTIILVTNNIKQAARVGDRVAFFYNGELIETGKTKDVFRKPKDKRTADYISGKFG